MPVGFNPMDGGKVSSPSVSKRVLLPLCPLELILNLDAEEPTVPDMFVLPQLWWSLVSWLISLVHSWLVWVWGVLIPTRNTSTTEWPSMLSLHAVSPKSPPPAKSEEEGVLLSYVDLKNVFIPSSSYLFVFGSDHLPHFLLQGYGKWWVANLSLFFDASQTPQAHRNNSSSWFNFFAYSYILLSLESELIFFLYI